ncbi:MAG: hypothetical protein ACLR8Y_20590 [Alistipes indistinctus]
MQRNPPLWTIRRYCRLVLFAQVKLRCIGGQFGLFVGEIDSGRSLFSVGLWVAGSSA